MKTNSFRKLSIALVLALAPVAAFSATIEERIAAVRVAYEQIENGFVTPSAQEREQEVRRLLPPNLFDKMLVEKNAPWWNSLRVSEKHWLEAADYVSEYDGKIDLAFFQEIGRISMQEQFFWGYEIRRINTAVSTGLLSKDMGMANIKRMDDVPVNYTGVDHSKLAGELRIDPVDNWVYRPEHVDTNGTRYFTEDEVKLILANPYFEKDPSSFVLIAPGKYAGTIQFKNSAHVREATKEVISQTNRAIRKAKTPKEKLYAITRGIRSLITIHPLLDGNGRSIRLLGDAWLMRAGFPPPLLMTENELMITVDEYAEFILQGMEAYIQMRETPAFQNAG